MRTSQLFFLKKTQPHPFPRIRLPAKFGDFEWQKSLWALQGYFVITDENSPFEWVGSVGAYPCIINLIHAIDDSGKKVAACAHLSRQHPDSVKRILNSMTAKEIVSVNLFSGCTPLSDSYTQALYKAYEECGVDNKRISFSFGQAATQAALHVKSGEITSNLIFFPENAGAKEMWDFDDLYEYPKLLVNGRNLNHAKQIKTLLRNIDNEFKQGRRSFDTIHPYGSVASFCKAIQVIDDDTESKALKSRLQCEGFSHSPYAT